MLISLSFAIASSHPRQMLLVQTGICLLALAAPLGHGLNCFPISPLKFSSWLILWLHLGYRLSGHERGTDPEEVHVVMWGRGTKLSQGQLVLNREEWVTWENSKGSGICDSNFNGWLIQMSSYQKWDPIFLQIGPDVGIAYLSELDV